MEKSGNSTLFSRAFTYDVAGQIVANSLDQCNPLATAPTTATVDAASELTAFGGTTYTSDAEGDRLTETAGGSAVISYTWDARGRLQSIQAPGGVLTSFVYDPGGKMIQKRVLSAGSDVTEKYTLDDALNIAPRSAGLEAPSDAQDVLRTRASLKTTAPIWRILIVRMIRPPMRYLRRPRLPIGAVPGEALLVPSRFLEPLVVR